MNNQNEHIEAFVRFNDSLRSEYQKIDKSNIKERLKAVGEFYNANRLDKSELAKYKMNSIAAVDGSLNSFGGAEPNVLNLISSCYLPDLNRERINKARIISPLVGDEDSPSRELARLEVFTAIDGIKKYKSHACLMDGGFIRFITNAESDFKELVNLANENGTILIGVIEDMKSKVVAESLDLNCYDREVVFGVLDYKEAFILGEKYRKNQDVGTVYLRSALSPQAIAIDYPVIMEDKIKEAIDIVLTLTPESGRGIPTIIDMVDKFTRITDREIEAYIKTYIDEDLRRIYLDEARKKRWM